MLETCYMCGAKATSKEHVPPQGIFPKQKEIMGFDLRKNLLTIPSCDEHNLKKSKDDEFLMACLAGIVGNNAIALWQTRTKIAKVFKRGKLESAVISNAKSLTITSDDGVKFPVLLGNADTKRLKNCFKHIAYGLYYIEFNKIFEGDLRVLPAFLNYEDENSETMKKLLEKRAKDDSIVWLKKGENPEVFYYQFSPRDEHGLITLIMTFYEGSKVYAVFKEKDIVVPFNLVAELMKAGMPVTLEFKDGTNLEFNKRK